jgi:hypothetical protein
VFEIKNQYLLSKWFSKLLSEEGVWQELIQNIYLHSKSLSEVTVKSNDSFLERSNENKGRFF